MILKVTAFYLNTPQNPLNIFQHFIKWDCSNTFLKKNNLPFHMQEISRFLIEFSFS